MSEYREFTGKTVEEALRQARDAFGVANLDDLDFEILSPGSRGVLGMGTEPARIVAAPRAALGGAAPRREAAAAAPLPPPPPRHEREGGRERGRGGERPFRDERPRREEHEPRREERPRGPRREERGPAPRRDEGRPVSRSGLDAVVAGAAVSPGEEAMVQAARASLTAEREELQAATASPEALQAGQVILAALMAHLGYEVRVEISAGETSRLEVYGANDTERRALGALIGRKGERLSALQHLLNLMLSKQIGHWTRLLVDVEGYRGRREHQLREIALRAAARVIETGKMLQLEAMPALERRWIHLALREHPSVSTQSIGEEPERRVVVLPRG
ncbi:MAG: hypothetical protein A2X23_11925 [Chloroflexi bacterium GWC2_73_18]|nr:MAG: hypothetical protein A2X23_11925 [Chloroflexi bacterium GWC2_73_18]